MKRLCIKSLPPVLCIQLKRFDYDWELNRAIKFDDYFKVGFQCLNHLCDFYAGRTGKILLAKKKYQQGCFMIKSDECGIVVGSCFLTGSVCLTIWRSSRQISMRQKSIFI